MLKSGKLVVIGYLKSLKVSLVAVQSIMTEHCRPLLREAYLGICQHELNCGYDAHMHPS